MEKPSFCKIKSQILFNLPYADHPTTFKPSSKMIHLEFVFHKYRTENRRQSKERKFITSNFL